MKALSKNSVPQNNNVLKTYFTQPSNKAWEDRILELALEQHSTSSHYHALYELALYLRNENCILLQWNHSSGIIDDKQNSFMTVADFIIRSNLPHRTFTLACRQNGRELVLDDSAKPSVILYWLNRLAMANTDLYMPEDPMPRRA
jgi:hypothetical protein